MFAPSTYRNRTSVDNNIHPMDDWHVSEWFLSDKNKRYMIKRFYNNYLQKRNPNEPKVPLKTFIDTVDQWMEQFIYNYNDFVEAPPRATDRYRRYGAALNKANITFWRKYSGKNIYGNVALNPYHSNVRTGTKNEFEDTTAYKSINSLLYTPMEWRNLDLWNNDESSTITWNKNNRYENKFISGPNLAGSRNRGHIIKNSPGELGYQALNPYRASLNTPVRGMRMEMMYNNNNNIKKTFKDEVYAPYIHHATKWNSGESIEDQFGDY